VPRGYNPSYRRDKCGGRFKEREQFRRLSYDIAVIGTWLTLTWAIEEEKNLDAVADIKMRIQDEPFDLSISTRM
jgi:hypothetical protein